jgi:GR25 family glycosyltransferase involved in LPS biosynthesis
MHYWINIDRCNDRRIFMEKQFNDLDIINERISAITPNDIKFDNIIKHIESTNTPEEYACILSHIKALYKGYNDGYEYFFVLEDDMNIIKIDETKIINLIKKYEKINNCIIDMVQLFTNSHPLIIEMYNDLVKDINESKFNENSLIKIRNRDYPSTGYYVVSREGAKKLLERFIIDYNEGKYDLSYSFWCAADNILYRPIDTYILTFPIVTSNIDCGSLIHNSHLSNHEIANKVIHSIHEKNNIIQLFM